MSFLHTYLNVFLSRQDLLSFIPTLTLNIQKPYSIKWVSFIVFCSLVSSLLIFYPAFLTLRLYTSRLIVLRRQLLIISDNHFFYFRLYHPFKKHIFCSKFCDRLI